MSTRERETNTGECTMGNSKHARRNDEGNGTSFGGHYIVVVLIESRLEHRV